jgi:hypothetical protein
MRPKIGITPRHNGRFSHTLGREATFRRRAELLAPSLQESAMEATENTATARPPWNKGKIVGQKTPFKLKEIWAIRIRLQLAVRRRELALFNLAIDSKLRACAYSGDGGLSFRRMPDQDSG